jgi:hypothetical protein
MDAREAPTAEGGVSRRLLAAGAGKGVVAFGRAALMRSKPKPACRPVVQVWG